jgi:hypothetical protein
MTVVESYEHEHLTDEEPPTSPFQALRVAYGMLLGVDDFDTLVGYPRGKQMLHNAWLHGSGVVWGFPVEMKGRELRVGPGLGIDGVGRELHLEADQCLDVEAWLTRWRETSGGARGGYDEEICVWLVANYRTCLAGPVPALANPCDLSRQHSDYSRFVETVHMDLVEEAPAHAPRGFHRIRVLLGLEPAGTGDEDCAQAIDDVVTAPPDQRAARLLEVFRRLAALDVADLAPRREEGDQVPNVFPVPEDQAGVVLAKVCLRPGDAKYSGETIGVDIDAACRDSLLPTALIQELTCGFAPGVLGEDSQPDAGGPRVDPESAVWESADCLALDVDRPLLEASLKGQSIIMTSLSERGWVREDISRIRYSEDDAFTVHVELHDPPAYDFVRLVVRGTGPAPVMGADYVPLAGMLGGPPGTEHDGHDAVLTLERSAAT